MELKGLFSKSLCSLWLIIFCQVVMALEVSVATNTATIFWEGTATNSVVYGRSQAEMNSYALGLGGIAILSNLEPGTEYWYGIGFREGSLTTLGRPPIRFSNFKIGSITKRSAFIEWETNLATDYRIQNLSADYFRFRRLKTGHCSLVTDLLPDTEYIFQIVAEDEEGQKGTLTSSFKTAENNMALGCPVSGTFDLLPDDKYVREGSACERITDDDLSYFTGTAQSGDIAEEDQWLVIDLGTETRISTVTVCWRALCYSQEYSILVKEKDDWKLVGSGINGDDGVFIRSDAGDPMRVRETAVKEEARFIKLACKKGRFFVKHNNWRFVQIMEVKIF